MNISDKELEELLVLPEHVTKENFDTAVRICAEGGISVLEQVVKSGWITDENLGVIVAFYKGLPFVNLKRVAILESFIKLIPEVVAYSRRIVVFEKTDRLIKVASERDDNYEFLKILEKQTGLPVKLYYSTKESLNSALVYYRGHLRDKVSNITDEFWNYSRNANVTKEETSHFVEERVVDLVNLFLSYAYDNKASDIHIEPLEYEVSVRFRVDGVLHEVATYPKIFHDKIVFRIKILSKLHTDEHSAPQDGRFTYTDTSNFDVRVSVLPVVGGENVVMRLLVERDGALSLDSLGLSKADMEKITRAIKKPHGMILSVGPTGSGKTTSLYTIIKRLNSPEVNIMTIEDPVEYNMNHIQQIQVNNKKKITFSSGLRSIVRQDPDIIMVGEIRDEETADISINAAMTGHMILSTMHTNDAATTFPRLIEMGVEPFLIASAVNMVMAQRLVRRICVKCKMSYHLSDDDTWQMAGNFELEEKIKKLYKGKSLTTATFYKGAGCPVCNQTGYSGRVGIFEIMELNDDIRTLILQKAPSSTIMDIAHQLGMATMLEDGLIKVKNGITTIDEVLRAANITK